MNLDHLDVVLSSKYCPGLGNVQHIRVNRVDRKDGITWDELQAVKNEYVGDEVTAIEIYPASYDLVNEGNYRHLWVLPDDAQLPNLKR